MLLRLINIESEHTRGGTQINAAEHFRRRAGVVDCDWSVWSQIASNTHEKKTASGHDLSQGRADIHILIKDTQLDESIRVCVCVCVRQYGNSNATSNDVQKQNARRIYGRALQN